MIGVVIATYGDRDEWAPMVERAADSVDRQSVETRRIWWHGQDLAGSRNDGARAITDTLADGEPVDWLIFLDADDELDDGYIAAMSAAVDQDRAVYRPCTLGVHDDDGHVDDAPCMIPRTDMTRRNCAVIGSMVPADLFHEVGGFFPFPCLEDWDLWIRMLRAGAELVDVPDAIYRVHVREDSRNTAGTQMNETYREIRQKHRGWRGIPCP